MISSTSDEQFDRSWIWIGAIGSVGFLLLSIFYYDFVLDDAYIIYRYAQNLVEYGSFTWNVGEKPVEGFTSFLWVILNASAIALGGDPIVFTKVISLAAALLIIWLLAYNSRTAPLEVAAIATFAIALSPPAVLLTWQGLETAFLSLLLLLSAVLSIRVVTRANARQMVWWYLIAFIAILTRPDSVAFNGAVGFGIVLVLLIDKRRDALRLFFISGCCLSQQSLFTSRGNTDTSGIFFRTRSTSRASQPRRSGNYLRPALPDTRACSTRRHSSPMSSFPIWCCSWP